MVPSRVGPTSDLLNYTLSFVSFLPAVSYYKCVIALLRIIIFSIVSSFHLSWHRRHVPFFSSTILCIIAFTNKILLLYYMAVVFAVVVVILSSLFSLHTAYVYFRLYTVYFSSTRRILVFFWGLLCTHQPGALPN